MPKPRAIGSEVCARIRLTSALGPSGDPIARPGNAQPRDAVKEAASELGRLLDPLVRRRRAQQKDRIKAASRERLAELSCLFYRQIEREHTVDAGG